LKILNSARESDPKTAQRIGLAQGVVLSLLLVAESLGADRLSVVQLISWLPSNSSAEIRRNTRVQYKRVVRGLLTRGLVQEAGTSVSVTGQATGSISDWIGRRVPIGYRREALAFSLTDTGRIKALVLNAARPAREQKFFIDTARALVLKHSQSPIPPAISTEIT
jgi:hypothetical protein